MLIITLHLQSEKMSGKESDACNESHICNAKLTTGCGKKWF